ncbi:MAG: hypothetical protein WCE62_19880 [Polyangiales bacterium]
MKRRWERPAIVATVAALALAAQLVGRAASESRANLTAAMGFEQNQHVALAIEHYRRAIRWSFPFSPYRGDAVSALRAIATRSEANGDLSAALSAWRSLAAGLAASRFLYSAADPELDQARDQIARLIVVDRSAAIDANLSVEQLVVYHRRLLDEQISPDPWWGTLLLMGMVVWVGALLVMARLGFDSSGRFRWTSAKGPLSTAAVGFVLFALGLLFA